MTQFLTLDDALFVVKRLGFHVRDAGLLASALARPATTIGGVDAYASLELKAAALLESLLRNPPLIDGNKRSSWTLTSAFLWINGWALQFDTDDAFDLILAVAEGRVDIDQLALALAARLGRRGL